jgi:hypothetical protein
LEEFKKFEEFEEFKERSQEPGGRWVRARARLERSQTSPSRLDS